LDPQNLVFVNHQIHVMFRGARLSIAAVTD
jgi:hypothetical protein